MATQKSIYEVLQIESNDGSKVIDLIQGAVSLDYYEDIFSPTITAKLTIVNVGTTVREGGKLMSLYNGLPLRGGERVSLKVAPNSKNIPVGLDFTNPKNYLYVSGVKNAIVEAHKESFTLNLVSREAITNETSRVVKRFPTDYTIDESVKEIMEESLLINKNSVVDKTQNPYGFIGNLKKPFTVLVWLASKAVPEGKNANAGFVFYQTKEAFNFRSLDGLVTQDVKYEYSYSEDIAMFDGIEKKNNEFNILNYYIDRNQDVVEKLRLGAFSSQRIFFNPLNFTINSPEEGLYTFDKKVETLGRRPKLPKINPSSPLTLGEVPSRIFTQILDIGTIDQDVSKDLNSDPLNYQSQSLMRYNLLLTQSLSIMIPCNFDLNAGDIIYCNIPEITVIPGETEWDRQVSGKYMIKELCHHIDTNNSYTSLKLIRDTFGDKR